MRHPRASACTGALRRRSRPLRAVHHTARPPQRAQHRSGQRRGQAADDRARRRVLQRQARRDATATASPTPPTTAATPPTPTRPTPTATAPATRATPRRKARPRRRSTVPADITVDATGPAGATVAYTVTATDDLDPAPTVLCTPSAGSLFAIGDTRSNASRPTHGGNTATRELHRHRARRQGQLAQLIDEVSTPRACPPRSRRN